MADRFTRETFVSMRVLLLGGLFFSPEKPPPQSLRQAPAQGLDSGLPAAVLRDLINGVGLTKCLSNKWLWRAHPLS